MSPTRSESQPVARLLRLGEHDNVASAVAEMAPGTLAECEGVTLTVLDRVPVGHKVAIAPIAAGDKVLKFGCPIGSATCNIEPGRHVHTHNLRSDYIPTFTLDDGREFIKP